MQRQLSCARTSACLLHSRAAALVLLCSYVCQIHRFTNVISNSHVSSSCKCSVQQLAGHVAHELMRQGRLPGAGGMAAAGMQRQLLQAQAAAGME